MKYPYLIVIFLTCLIAIAELFLRLVGFHEYQYADIEGVDCSPMDHVAISNYLGYCNRPGHFSCQIKRLPFTVYHLPDSSRATKATNIDSIKYKGTIHLYGGSVTWGHGLSDSVTMAWQLQEALPEWNVKNYGIGAGSIVQSYLWLKNNVQQGKVPDIIMINYSSFHNMRNSMSWPWRKVWQTILHQAHFKERAVKDFHLPYAKVNAGQLQIRYMTSKQINQNLPFVHSSALANLINNSYQMIKDQWYIRENTTYQLLLKMERYCQSQGIQLVLNGITKQDGTKEMLKKCTNEGILSNNLSIGFLKNEQFNLSPYDHHPNAFANHIYAYKTLLFLKGEGLL